MEEMSFRTLACREYISKRGIGNGAECESLFENLCILLHTMSKDKLIAGFTVRLLASDQDIWNEELEEYDLLKYSDGKMPFVWVNITYFTPQFDSANQERFEVEQDLILVGENQLYG
jgi:hypothetical protein